MIHYLITDPAYYGSDADTIIKTLEGVLQTHTVDFICYRDKTNPYYRDNAMALKEYLEGKQPKLIVHQQVEVALEQKTYGIHLTSKQYEETIEAKKAGLYVVASTHNEKEIRRAVQYGSDACTYSPIFNTPHKGCPKGLEELKLITGKMAVDIIALGGIVTPDHVDALRHCNIYGFASIRYFVKG